MDANAKAIIRARQIAKDYINRVGDWYDEKAVSKAIEYMGEIYHLPDDTLRNCDVGTAEEQAERYLNFCHNYPKCTGCPCVGRILYNQCQFAWAQLPYVGKEGGAK